MTNSKSEPVPTKSPATLGDSVFITKRERHSLPPRTQIGKIVQEIIDEGGIQKILLQVGQPILVERLVAQGSVEAAINEELEAVPQIEREDIYYAVRNSDMEELRDSEKFPALESLFRAFVLISHRRLRPMAFLVHSTDVIRAWMKLDQLFGLEELFGVPLIVAPAVPEGTVLLASGSEEQVKFTVRISAGV